MAIFVIFLTIASCIKDKDIYESIEIETEIQQEINDTDSQVEKTIHERVAVFKDFSFVQLCDVQLGYDEYSKDLEAYINTIHEINEMGVDFVVVCGDLVNKASQSSFDDFNWATEQFTIPIYLTAGNHDVGNEPTILSLEFYRKNIGLDYYSFNFNQVNFIMTNTQLWKYHVDEESQKHNEFVLNEIKSSKGRTFVLGHYPLFIDSIDEDEGYYSLPKPKRNELLNVFQNNNVEAYLSGHRHNFIENEYNGIKLVSGEALTKNAYRKNGYRVWNVTANGSHHYFKSIVE